MIKIKKGVDLPITGAVSGVASGDNVVTQQTARCAVLGGDYIGMRPAMKVRVGDVVKKGTVLFEDKKTEGVVFTSPITGTVTAVNRGDKRKLLSVVVERNGNEAESFPKLSASSSREDIVKTLIDSGLWVAFRTRPFSRSPQIDSTPDAIFVNAMDTNPLAIEPSEVIAERQEDFNLGLELLTKLSEKVFVTSKAGKTVDTGSAKVEKNQFDGVHPAGNAGTHIHFLFPVNEKRTVWTVNYQDVIAIGATAKTGELDSSRVIAVAGPAAKSPKFVKTEIGADISELCKDQSLTESVRVISGSVFSGTRTSAETVFLGRFHNQVSLLEEGYAKELFGWILPGKNQFSVTKAYMGHLSEKKYAMTTATNGSARSMVPIGVYEKVMPMDILPTLLLKALIMKDTESAQQLGVLELDEEDMALMTFVCPGKYEYGAILRENLEHIEAEG